ncbi:43289_t:CDS:2, partial [Gigaspora margarita]
CHEANGGYLHRRLGRRVLNFGCDSKHNDLSVILENFGNWIQLVAKLDNKLQKQQLIWSLLLAIETLKPCLPKDLIYILPTLLMIQIAFKLAKIDLSAKAKAVLLKEKEYQLAIGLSEVTKNLNKNYDQIFEELLLKKMNNFDINDIHQKVIENVKIGCNFDKLKIVILKPSPAPNSNKNVYETCDMFLNDIANTEVTTIDIACDEAIFQRLKNYNNQNLTTNIILGQWHTSKDMCQALIAAFFGYGIFNIAAQLG